MEEKELERLKTVKEAHEAELLRKLNVVGVGIGLRKRGGEMTNEPVILVSVTRKLPSSQLAPQDIVPRDLEGFPVDVQEIGKPRAF